MTTSRQYIELYQECQTRVNNASAPILNALRPEALRALGNARWPRKGDEDYEHSDLSAILDMDWGINLDRRPLHLDPADTFSCQVPNLSTSLYFLSGDTFAQTPGSAVHLPNGVLICSLRKAAVEHPELVEPYYGRLADMANPLVALNTLFAQDGFFMYVPKGVKLERPIQLVSMLGGEQPMMAVRRMLIVMEQGASATLLCCDHTQRPDMRCLNLLVDEVHLASGASLQLYEIEESTPLSYRLASSYTRQLSDSDLLMDTITLYNGFTRNESHCLLPEPGASLQLLGMGIEDETRSLDTLTHIQHDAPHCTSHELFKYVVDGSATGAFAGRIYVAPGAVKTDARQSNRNLVASPTARMFSKPQLEIYADDVKCSHGTAIGQLDPAQIFYMQTRGLDENQAKTLLRQAFMADVIEAVRMERLRDRLRHLVETRLDSAAPAIHSCKACNGACQTPNN